MDAPEPDLPADKPEAARIGWTLLESRQPFDSPVNRLRADRLEVPGRGRSSIPTSNAARASSSCP